MENLITNLELNCKLETRLYQLCNLQTVRNNYDNKH